MSAAHSLARNLDNMPDAADDRSEVRSAIFRDGVIVERVALAGSTPREEDAEFIWIELHRPSDADFDILKERFQLHGLAVDDAMRPTHVAKVDLYEDQIFVVLKIARLEADEIMYAETEAFVSKRHIITIHHEHGDAFSGLRDRFDGGVRSALVRPDFILHAIMDAVVDSYFPVIQMIEDEVLSIEQKLVDGDLGPEGVTRLFHLRRQALRFQHVVTRMLDVCGKLINLDVPCIGPDVRPYFRDVHDHLIRLDAMIGGLVEVIRAVFEASTLLEQQRQGLNMRQLTAWAGIVGVPAAIAGLHDMLLDRTAEPVSTYGYYSAIGLMVIACLALYLRFRRLRWL